MRLRPLKFITVALVMASTQGCVPRSVQPQVVAVPAPPPQVVVAPAPSDLAARLAALATNANPEVIRLAVEAETCAARQSGGDRASLSARRLAVIDYSMPSTARRLWVFDLAEARLLYNDFVAHGRNTGDNLATRFSNIEGSLQSSLGLFRTAETYEGENGYSLRMDGLEPGINDLARPRAIVMHGAWYVDPQLALKQGRLGRSLGCPALRPQVARHVIDALKQGQALFAYYPDKQWLANSRYVGCRQDEPAGGIRASLHAAAR